MDRNSLANTANRTTQIQNQADAAEARNDTTQNGVDVRSRGVDNQEKKTAFQIGKNGSLNGGENQAFQKAKEKYLSPTGDGYGKSPAEQDVAVEKLRQSYMARGQAPSITGNLPRPGAPMEPPAAAGTMPSGGMPVGQSVPSPDDIKILRANPGSASYFERMHKLPPGSSKQYLQ